MVAGADFSAYGERLKQIRAANDRIREEYTALNREFPSRKRDLAANLQQSGFPEDQIREELLVREKAWNDEYKAMMNQLTAVDRRNERRFEEVSQQLFARLRHEAFHAYVENYLYPQRGAAFPRWLNEGLAQVFETAQLDGETLRFDAPDRELLRRLQADLAGEPLPLAEVLAAAESDFLSTHSRVDESQRRYLYSWGLAWRLLSQGRLTREGVDAYVAVDPQLSPIARFEQLTGEKLPAYELRWRDAILKL
jgi:hypothetical protein